MPARDLINPSDPPDRQIDKLLTICSALMTRIERGSDDAGAAYAQFQRAVLLEDQVRQRTRDLEQALGLLNASNAQLALASAEAERARSDLAEAIETLREGFALFGPDGALVLCNSRFGQGMPDLRPHLLPGLHFDRYIDLASQSPALALPDGQTPASWAASRKARQSDDHVVVNVALTGDRWMQVSQHRTEDGRTVIIQTDVSDIIRMERLERSRELDDQARMVRVTLDHINEGVGIFDTGARLLGFNARLDEYLAVGLRIGSGVERMLSALPPEDAEACLGWIAEGAGRGPLRLEFRRGASRVFALFAREIPDQGFVVSLTDVTTEREAARALSDANERLEERVTERTLELEDALGVAERAIATRSRFVAAASHDLLQPLSAAKLFLSSLQADLTGSPQAGVLGKAQNALDSVTGMIEALLDISRLEAGRAAVDLAEIDLGALLRQLADEFAPVAARKGLDLRIVPTSAQVRSDPTYCRRILQNLLSNAIRYTPSGKVVVGVRRQRATVRVEVWDTGPGIAAEDQEAMFQEFKRGTGQGATEGLGLGLAIVDRACATLGHPLSMDSTPGLGTVFRVTMPVVKGAGRRASNTAVRIPHNRWRHDGLVVLLIENDPDMRRALALLLEKWHAQVLDVASGAEAKALMEEIDLIPDAMLVDYKLAGEERGTDTIRDLRAAAGPIPARIITARRTVEVQAAAEAVGVGILTKPITPVDLHLFLETAGISRR